MKIVSWVISFGILAAGIHQLQKSEKQTAEVVVAVRPPLGHFLASESRFINRKINLGRMMFQTNWLADTGAKFNNRNCTNCHDNPVTGGSNRRPPKDVLMVQDLNHIGGWSNSRRFLQLKENMNQGSFHVLEVPNDAVIRKSPALFGIGLLDGIPIKDILKNADPKDNNHDGISGRAQKLPNGEYGRFGWKLTVASLNDFVKEAFEIEVGVKAFDPKTHPIGTIDGNQIDATAWFLRMLAPPEQDPAIASMAEGKRLFSDLNCTSCHTPTWKTAKNQEPALSEKMVSPYTDLLLHQMGKGPMHLGSGKVETREVRTPALWGIGAIGGAYLHDKSAKTLHEAIEIGHDGEGAVSRQKFRDLSVPEQISLLDFVKSL